MPVEESIVAVQELPVKFNDLNQLVVVNVCVEEPLVIDKLGALAVEPLVVPKVNVLVVLAALLKPPVPVQVKLVAVPMFSTVVAAVVCANTMVPEPNAMARVVELLELNWPVVNVNPARANVPLFNVVALVAAVLRAPAKVVVPE